VHHGKTQPEDWLDRQDARCPGSCAWEPGVWTLTAWTLYTKWQVLVGPQVAALGGRLQL
jgi:hypothetical protein